jgi:adenylate cyclase
MPFSKYLPEHMGSIKLAPGGPFVAGSFAELTLVYTAGTFGIDDTGMVKISWRTTSDMSKPQFDKPRAANFTTVEASNGAKLEVWFDKLNVRPYANTLWADRYEGDLTDIFALQDEITKKVVAAIEPKLLEAEGTRSRSRSPEDLSAWDMVIQANSLFWRLTTAEREAAIAVLRRAVERYPDYAPAQSMLAFVLLISGYLGWVLMESQLQEAAGLAARAEELDPSDPWAHLALGYVAFVRRRTSAAAAEFQRALDLNPNFAAAHGYLGWALAFDGQSEQAIAHLKEAIRMSPHDPQNAIFNSGLAIAHYLAGRFAEAVEYSRETLQQRSAFTAGHRIHCASLAQNGQIDEAREALAGLKEVHPDLSIAWIESNVPYTAAPMAKFVEGMRKAGLK